MPLSKIRDLVKAKVIWSSVEKRVRSNTESLVLGVYRVKQTDVVCKDEYSLLF